MEVIERFAISQDWITLILILAMVLLVVSKFAFPHRFADFAMLFATNKYLLIRGKEPNLFHSFNILLFIVNTISAALFIYIFYQTFTSEPVARPNILFLRIATAYAAFVLLKFSLDKIVASILSLDKIMDHYLFYKLSYRNFIALLLLPLSVIFTYIWEPGAQALYISLGFILLINMIVMLGIFAKNQQYISKHWFYFILYLCALEIGPYYILYKLFTEG